MWVRLPPAVPPDDRRAWSRTPGPLCRSPPLGSPMRTCSGSTSAMASSRWDARAVWRFRLQRWTRGLPRGSSRRRVSPTAQVRATAAPASSNRVRMRRGLIATGSTGSACFPQHGPGAQTSTTRLDAGACGRGTADRHVVRAVLWDSSIPTDVECINRVKGYSIPRYFFSNLIPTDPRPVRLGRARLLGRREPAMRSPATSRYEHDRVALLDDPGSIPWVRRPHGGTGAGPARLAGDRC